MTKIKIKLLRSSSVLPKRAFPTDSCFDVTISKLEIVNNDNLAICYLGFSTEIPDGYKGVVVPRSGQTKTRWAMLNSPGQIDSTYRGEWQVRFSSLDINPGGDDEMVTPFPFKVGDRCAQMYFDKVEESEFVIMQELNDTDRGSGGFGHTGQ